MRTLTDIDLREQPPSPAPDEGDRPVDDDVAVAAALLADSAGSVVEDWRELCRWDPELPPDADPPAAGRVVGAVIDALHRPQPLGWGTDEQVAAAMDVFTDLAGPLAIPELICLREAVSRRLRGRIPHSEMDETWSRLQMIFDRAIAWATRRAFAQLERDACVDPLTGVLNRRAFEIEMSRQLGRVARHGGTFSVVVIDVDGLKAVNDTLGHLAGDARLQGLSAALRSETRREDSAYRLGGDEFAVVLPEADPDLAESAVRRMARAAAPTRVSWGLASCPQDGDTLKALVQVADTRLYSRRSEARRGQVTRPPAG